MVSAQDKNAIHALFEQARQLRDKNLKKIM